MLNSAMRSAAVMMSAFLASCGAVGGNGCSGIEMVTDYNDLYGSVDVTLRNTTSEPKLLTVALVGSDGKELKSNSLRVDAKDIADTRVSNMRSREDIEIELTRCD
tara:strand:- start:13019 stop:13333 length:315 start_codon:yes stop_codon:yes gene_type:complete